MSILPWHLDSRAASVLRVAGGTVSLVEEVLKQAKELKNTPKEVMQTQGEILKQRILANPIPELWISDVFPWGYEAVRRIRGIELHPCQISGGIILARGGVAEMATGEGKTLTAVLPVMLWGLMGRGVHVVTTNDYLAERDAKELRPIYEVLGLSVGCITTDQEPEARRQAYSRDVTYATAKEIGFDFLRDRMTLGAEYLEEQALRYAKLGKGQSGQLLQRSLYASMVDEADSVLIDDARTPLIIGKEAPHSIAMTSLFRWCLNVAIKLDSQSDYIVHTKLKQIVLTEFGAEKILLGDKPPFGQGLTTETLLEHIERMLEALIFFKRDKQYAVIKGEIVLLDESTDRPMEGRKLQRGLHHCLEAKEGLPLTAGTKTASKVTVQSYFRKYRFLSGMTGTAAQAAKEFRQTYRLKVTTIPTHLPCLRTPLPARVFVSQEAKCSAIVEVTREMLSEGRPLLIGTPSVGASERLSLFFKQAKIPHQILNAHKEKEEAEIIARAGQSPVVTIATNMAGRGTDIKLSPAVTNVGGLHVIATEMHHSLRVDRQLIGRAARQGDPGSYQIMVSLEDELLYFWPDAKRARWLSKGKKITQGELPANWLTLFQQTQQKLEKHHRKTRKKLLKAEQKKMDTYARLGWSPYLETFDEG